MHNQAKPNHGTPIQIRLQRTLLEALESWRREQENIPSRPEAIRQLLRLSLFADANGRPIRQ